MNAKKFLLLTLLNPIIIILIITFALFINAYYPKNDLNEKEYLIKDYEPMIIFAGDSRAERQLNVKEAQNLLNLNDGDIVNIAMSSADAIMLNYLIDKYPEKFKNKTLILSLSANQLNDNAKDPGYFSFAMISKLNLLTQLKTFFPQNIQLLRQYYSINCKFFIKSFFNYEPVKEDSYKNTYGFNPINKYLNTREIDLEHLSKNPWYTNYKDGDIKYKTIEKSLLELKNKVGKLYIYTAPFAPSYIDLIKNDRLLENELSFKNKVKQICELYNINYINYLTIEELKDENFYDISHLNVEGSIIFTKRILKDFGILKNN